MNQVKAFLGKYWHSLFALAVVALVIYLVYRAGKKSTPVIVSDTGQLSQADIDKSTSLATRLKDDLSGLNFGHDDTIYESLAQSSNTVFALTFATYRQLSGSSLAEDISGDVFYGWSVIPIIINRASDLNIT
jgi:hypothetical protein